MQQVQELISNLEQTTQKNNIITIFQQLEEKLKQYKLQVTLFQGDNIIEKVITLFKEHLNELNISELKTCRNLISSTLQHKQFVSHQSAADIYKYTVQIIIQHEKYEECTIIAFLGILLDFFLRINVHYYDPRRDRNDVFQDENHQKRSLKHIFIAIQQIYQKLPPNQSNWKYQLPIQLLNSINYESPQIIEQYFEYYFGSNSIVVSTLNSNTNKDIVIQGLKTIAQASRAAKKQLKHAEVLERCQSMYTQKNKQAEDIKNILKKLQELYKNYENFDRDLQKQLNYTFTNVLQQINYYNIKIDFYQYIQDIIVGIIDERQKTILKLKLSQILLDLLKQDIYDLIIFNTNKQGQYYMNLMNNFQNDFVYSVRYVLRYISYIENEISDNEEYNVQKPKQKNKFAMLVNDDDEEVQQNDQIYLTKEQQEDTYMIQMHMQLINTYIANFPMISILIDRYQEHMNPLMYKGQNIVQQLIDIILEKNSIDMKNTCFFIQQLQHGCNMITNILNVVRDTNLESTRQSKNMQFIQFYVNRLLNVKRGQTYIYTQELVKQDIDAIYTKVIIPSIKKMTQHKVDYYEYFSVLYHMPTQLYDSTIDGTLFCTIYDHIRVLIQKQIQVHKGDIRMQQELSRKLYAFQVLAKTKMFQDGGALQKGVEFLNSLLGKSSVQPNNKKPILQTLGSLISLGLANDQSVYLNILKEAQKSGRQQSTAIRILQFIVVKYDVSLKIEQNIPLQDIIDALKDCIEGSKETTSYAALVVFQKIYDHWKEIYENQIIEKADQEQLSDFKNKTATLNKQILQCVTDKQAEMRQVYPNTVGNQFRRVQVEKYMIQSMTLLGSCPLYLLNINTFRLISYEFSSFISLFGYNKTPIMKANKVMDFFISAFEANKTLYKPEKSIENAIIEYLNVILEDLSKEVERFRNDIKYYADDGEFEPIEREIKERETKIEEIKQKLAQFK